MLHTQHADFSSFDGKLDDARCRFGKRIKDIRRSRGMSQEMLAEATGKTREYIGYLERGDRSPSFEMIILLSIVLEVKIADLIESIPLYKR